MARDIYYAQQGRDVGTDILGVQARATGGSFANRLAQAMLGKAVSEQVGAQSAASSVWSSLDPAQQSYWMSYAGTSDPIVAASAYLAAKAQPGFVDPSYGASSKNQ